MKKIVITTVAVLAAVLMVYVAFEAALKMSADSPAAGSVSQEAAAATGLAVPSPPGQAPVALPPGEQDAAGPWRHRLPTTKCHVYRRWTTSGLLGAGEARLGLDRAPRRSVYYER